MAWEGREPLRDWICLSVSLCFCVFQIVPFHRFLYSRRSVTPIGLNFGHGIYPEISFLAEKEGLQPPYGVATRVRGTLDTLGRAPLPRAPLGHRLAMIPLPKIYKYSKINLRQFLFRLVWVFCETKNMQQTGTGTGH